MTKVVLSVLALCLFLLPAPAFAQGQSLTREAAIQQKNAHDFTFTTPDGKAMPLSAYKGKVILIVNTATGCGFAGQLSGLQTLHEKYKDKGLVVLGVPSNDFGGQEPLDNTAMAASLKKSHGVTFPVTAKTVVSGKAAHDFYVWAGSQNVGNLLTNKPRWNFHKYLVGRDGQLLDSRGATTAPLESGFTAKIDAALAKKDK